MPIEHPGARTATVKLLYAHAFRCARPECRRPLYRVDEASGERTLNSRVCHINARREGGPRWDAEQSEEANRSADNLVLMCIEHASAIDDAANVSSYPPELLREWKRLQIEEYDKLQQGWALNDEMAREASEPTLSNVEIAIYRSSIVLGGEGGKAPGAGGGGGGAIGRNAKAGSGGPGGNTRIADGEYTLPIDADIKALDFTEEERAPGAGGGGGGAVGDDAIGGDGGGGGEQVIANIDLVAMQKDGLDHIELDVGVGGMAPALPGQLPKPGGDTVVKFVTKDGRVLKTIKAAGGMPGENAGHPDGTVEVSADDIEGGFNVNSLMLVRSAEFNNGAMYVLGGGWTTFAVPQIPCDATWGVVCEARWRAMTGAKPRGLFLTLTNPAGREVSRVPLYIPSDDVEAFGNRCWWPQIGALLDSEGLWLVQITSGRFVLSEVPVLVKVASARDR